MFHFVVSRTFHNFDLIVCTILMKLRLFYWHIEKGKKLKFYGLTRIKKHYQSNIAIGENCTFRSSLNSNSIGIKQACFLSTGKNAKITIGKNCGFSGTVIAASEEIIIGNNVIFGANTTVTDADRHALNFEERSRGEAGGHAPVNIHDHVWIGMNVVILKGVNIGEGAVIGANAVVCKDVPAFCVAAGNPAKVIKS